ncbi:MAG: hypothetical protein CVU38_02210 [Chloroflexi bacterium HGW-Chloroflexi-1]|nr:MAG: hypothetical protein CVU38_02210 [Chloroflexi bacterium HGW-Chloroflexi-1]
MRERLLIVVAVVALLLAVALPALPSISSDGGLTIGAAGVAHADDPTPTPANANCQGGTTCG